MSDIDSDVEFDIGAAAELALSKLLAKTSEEKYQKAYDKLKKWCSDEKVVTINEKVLLAYFSVVFEKFKASSIWSNYSMIKSTLKVKDNIDISDFHQLTAYLKRKGDDYMAKKSKVFQKEEIYRFVKEAPESPFFVAKIALIIGVFGACRRGELTKMNVADVEFMENGIKILVPETKTKIIRQFVIGQGDDEDVDFVEIIKRYAKLRPAGVGHSRFFVSFRNGKCTKQPVGINTFGSYPSKIATFLKLPSPEQYTGHCFRRTSESLLAEGSASVDILKRHGGWVSTEVAEGYVETSTNSKRKIYDQIMGTKLVKLTDGATSST